jgi:hypothetical protein
LFGRERSDDLFEARIAAERIPDRQADDDEHDNQTNYPIRNIEDRQYLRDALRKGPAADDVSNRDFVRRFSSAKKLRKFISASEKTYFGASAATILSNLGLPWSGFHSG